MAKACHGIGVEPVIKSKPAADKNAKSSREFPLRQSDFIIGAPP
jgi:hypothetical protein